MSEKNGLSSRMTRAWTPSSRTSTFEPPPRILNGDPLVPAAPEQSDQFLELSGAGEERGRSTQSEPDPRGQRLIGLDDPGEVVE